MDNDLKEGLARLTDPVVPEPDPYGRLLNHARRRRRRQTLLSSAAALVAVAVALPLLGVVGPFGTDPATPADAAHFQPAAPISTPLVRRLLDSPTRGNLAGNAKLIDEIARGYLAAREELLVDPALDRVKVLFADDLPEARVVVVAFVNDTEAVIRQGSAGPGASVRDLLDKTGTQDRFIKLSPYVIYGSYALPPAAARVRAGDDIVLQLMPAGCLAETSADGRINADGSVTRSWHAAGTDGFILRGPGQNVERWRFTCDGVVQYSAAGAGGRPWASPRPDAPAIPTAGARGTVDSTIAANAARALTEALIENGLTAVPPRVVWGGQIPGAAPGTPPVALATACYADGGCAAALQVGKGKEAVQPVHTAVGRPDLVVTRIPDDTDGVLVVGRSSATRAELLDADGRVIAKGPLVGGIGRLTLDWESGQAVRTLKVYGTSDHLLDSMPVAPDLGFVQFGETRIWKD